MGKVALGLSGGVDSAVSAALLKEQGYEVVGVHLVCFRESGCRADEDRKDALAVALKLKITFQVLDFREAYHDKVLGYFWSEIKQGRTPNPDIICNQEIKFGLFYQWALKNGFDWVATGHYARIGKWQMANGKWQKTLEIPKDKAKDQTYFLYRLQPVQLEHLIFPLADLAKTEVRALAKKKGLAVAGKRDSTGICFIGELNIHNFLKKKLGEKRGQVVDPAGKIVGTHHGYWFFTIGQRGGWKQDPKIKNKELKIKGKNGDMPRLYVVGKDKKRNLIIVGTRQEAMKKEFRIEDINWLRPFINRKSGILHLSVRIRHQGKLLRIKKLELRNKGKAARIILEEPAFGVASGQSAVLYQNGVVLGGGIIV